MKSYNSMIAENSLDKDGLPYERFLTYGAANLTDAELLAIIIRTGSKVSSPVDIARQVMSLGQGKNKGLNSLFNLTVDELMNIHGIGQIKAIKLLCIAELAKRMSYQKASATIEFNEPETVAEYYMEKLRHEDREHIILLCLDNRLKLIQESTLSIGTVNSALISPRDVFMQALKCGASNLILLHNHPAGDPTPSRADIATTNKIIESGKFLDIILRDHIIIGDMTYCSLKESGLLWQ